MERLTKREKAQLSNGEECVICNHEKADCNDSCIYGRCKWNKKAIEKLKVYEDKQEQGLLIELPCKVGDKLYQIGKGHYEIGTDITEYTVTAITISKLDIIISVKDEKQLGFPISAVYLGKRLYLTRSEAEEALAKMGGKLWVI